MLAITPLRPLISLLAAAQVFACAARADPYPFDGYFALKTPGPPHAGCGFDLLHQSKSGAFSGYILDRPHWEAHGIPRFVRYKHGACTYDATTGIDNCVARVNHITAVSEKPDRAKVTVLGAHSVAMLTLGDETAEALAGVPPFVFERCPFEEAQIAPLLADTASQYSKEALAAMARARDARVAADVVNAIAKRDVPVD